MTKNLIFDKILLISKKEIYKNIKQFKKALLSFVLIVCAVFLCACGSTPPPVAQIDTLASVNTSGTYTESSISELNPYLTDGDPAYIGNTSTGYHMSQKYTTNGQTIMSANFLFKVTDGTVTEMARKMSMDIVYGPMTMTVKTLEYLKNDTYYNQEGDVKYFIDNQNDDWDEIIGSELAFDFTETLLEDPDSGISTLLLNPNLTVTKAVEGTTIKFKATTTTTILDEGDLDGDGDTTEEISSETETVVLVVKNGKFDGIKYVYEYTEEGISEKIEINMVSFTGNIEFPSSFSGYVAYDPAIHNPSMG